MLIPEVINMTSNFDQEMQQYFDSLPAYVQEKRKFRAKYLAKIIFCHPEIARAVFLARATVSKGEILFAYP